MNDLQLALSCLREDRSLCKINLTLQKLDLCKVKMPDNQGCTIRNGFYVIRSILNVRCYKFLKAIFGQLNSITIRSGHIRSKDSWQLHYSPNPRCLAITGYFVQTDQSRQNTSSIQFYLPFFVQNVVCILKRNLYNEIIKCFSCVKGNRFKLSAQNFQTLLEKDILIVGKLLL